MPHKGLKNQHKLHLHSNCSEYNIISIKFELESTGGIWNAPDNIYPQPLTPHMPTSPFLVTNTLRSSVGAISLH